MGYYPNLHGAVEHSISDLINWGQDVDPGHWQGVSTEGHPDMVTKEILDLDFCAPIPKSMTLSELRDQIKPNLPWADDHFAERLSRDPSNPGEQYKNWPWWTGAGTQVETALNATGVKFTHTYQERFWPKHAGEPRLGDSHIPMEGIRYDYGDLDDVVNLLRNDPQTRQAYLPIFFPEDTGAVHGGRIPCTLGYQFMRRNDLIHMWYTIRSCDAVRHFRDDVYLAARLLLWVLDELSADGDGDDGWPNVKPGNFYFKAFSFHVHHGDMHHVRQTV